MTSPRSYDEVHAEQVAVAADAVRQAQADNDSNQAVAQQWLISGTAPTADPVTPAHTD